MTLDPAERILRLQKSCGILPEFDPNTHQHVIENFYCSICEIQVTDHRTKHCRTCNKCVSNF
uniref:Protein S-acyltransferase n=1 Tax=Mesocestoides corti TaxID=53468 RepID=A0A5K3G1W7_MESCO